MARLPPRRRATCAAHVLSHVDRPRRDAQDTAASGRARKTKRSRKTQGNPPPGPDELAAFYAAKVNSDEYLPLNMISAAMCGLMLARGLVTPERLRMRGVR